MKKILVLSGGGIKGLIQLPLLAKIEAHYQKPIHKIFDLVVGTSVGAITGGILASGKYSAHEYMDTFYRESPKIFATDFKTWFRLLRGKPKYTREAYYDMVSQRVDHGGSFVMNRCKTKFMCTSVNLCDNRTHFFKSWEHKDGFLKLTDVVARSFAAPYYFGMKIDNDTKSLWVDGGTGETNCPIVFAYVESLRQGWDSDHVEFTVIGAGISNESLDFEKGKNIGNVKQILRFLMPSEGGMARLQSTSVKIERFQALAKYSPNVYLNYYDIAIEGRHDTMDKVKYKDVYLRYGRNLASGISL